MMQIGIVGLGLIGGSLALDWRSQGHRIIGVSRRAETCEQAQAIGAVDVASTSLEILSTADVVVLCTPISSLRSMAERLLPHLKSTAILTDVGSVKASVVAELSPLWPRFVGGHPMAGKAESGLAVAEAGLFTGKAYVLTPIAQTDPIAVEQIAELASALGAIVHHCQPEDHDRAVAWISHAPVVISASLIAACMGESDPVVLDLAQTFASSGFRDTSRVGGGVPDLGLMMAMHNKEAILRSLTAYQKQLGQMMTQIEQENWTEFTAQLTATQTARPLFLAENKYPI